MAEVIDISIERQQSVTVTYDDGVRLELPLIDLRGVCPCATCRGQRERGIEPWSPRPGRETPTIVDASLVGAWGLSIQWDDGHDTGIYSWDGLRRWFDDSDAVGPDEDGAS